jgi:signal transduction histidine kinase/ligand-binding sensor domain-containing protein
LALDRALDVSQYAHTGWKVRESFFKGAVHAIAETPDGYLWLGTDFGLLRFDGVRSITWQPAGDQHLPSETIMSLLAAHDGSLWIGTLQGLVIWKNGKLERQQELAGLAIMTLLEDREGTVWAGAYGVPKGKLCAIHGARVECHGEDGSLGDGAINLYEDSKGGVWSGVRTGLWKWKPGAPKFYPIPGEPDGIRGIGEDDDGALLIGVSGGLRRFVDGRIERYPPLQNAPKFHAEKLLRDHDGALWVATTDHGLVHIHQGKLDVFGRADGLTAEYARNLFESHEGAIWVATLNGLDRFRQFAVATLSLGQGLSNATVPVVLADKDGSVWLSTFGGLDRWEKGKIVAYGEHGGMLNGMPPNSMFQDHSGRIWVSTPAGLGHLESNRFVPIKGPLDGFVNSIAEDKTENLWIANQVHGLFRLVGGNVAEQIPWTKLGDKGPATALAADPVRGGLWLGFSLGGVAYFSDGRVQSSYAALDGLAGGRVNDLRVDSDGTLWAATDGGLGRIRDGHVASLTKKSGLPCDVVHASLQDDNRASWLNMTCGLVRISGADLDAWSTAVAKDRNAQWAIQSTVFDGSEGARSYTLPDSYSPQAAKSSDGRLWFASMEGANVVDPRHLSFNKLPPPVYVEQVTADRKAYDVPPAMQGVLSLPSRVHDLQIDYTALSYIVPEKVLFKYRLEGRDKEWQDAGTRRQAFYSDLPPRQYRFRVAACNNSGVWNETGAFLECSIAPAYYQTTWFLALCVVAFVALLWAIHQYRLRQMERQHKIGFEARVGERLRIARELHDTLLQSLQGLLLRFQTASNLLPARPEEAKQKLDNAIELAAEAVTEGRGAVQGLRSSATLTNELASALNSLAKELAGNGANEDAPSFRLDMEGTARDLHPLLRDEVYRIAGEALRNAFKHAEAKQIEVEIQYDASRLRLRIRDDGKGIAQEVIEGHGRTGHWGLHGMRERARIIGGSLEVWSTTQSGTEVELTIPAAVAYATAKRSAHS